jgi:hypothetical protein
VTVIDDPTLDDPTEIFESLALPLSCSGTCAAASALAASDTCPSQTARAPMFGSSGRSVGAPIYGLPYGLLTEVSVFMVTQCVMVSGACPFGSSAKCLKYVVTLKSKTMCREDRRKRRRRRGSRRRDPKRKRGRGSDYTAAPRLGLYVLLLSPGTALTRSIASSAGPPLSCFGVTHGENLSLCSLLSLSSTVR